MQIKSLPEKSPFLEGLWQEVLAEKGWTARDLQRASGVSYNYVRHIVDGKVVPAKNALRPMCAAAGLDFSVVWQYMHDKHLLGETDEQARGLGADIVRTAKSHALDSPQQQAEDDDDFLPEMIAVYKSLPLIAKYQLLNTGWRLANQYGIRVSGFNDPSMTRP